jgi:hypothetical protein
LRIAPSESDAYGGRVTDGTPGARDSSWCQKNSGPPECPAAPNFAPIRGSDSLTRTCS